MTKMYIVFAAVITRHNGWTSSKQMPTFYLNPDLQGITDEAHAESIVQGMFASVTNLVKVIVDARLVDIG